MKFKIKKRLEIQNFNKLVFVKYFFIPLILIVTINLTSCNKSIEFTTIEELVTQTVHYINQGEKDGLLKTLVTKKEYIKKIYPYSVAKSSKEPLSSEDFWRIFIQTRRINAMLDKFRIYKNRIVKIDHIGNSNNIINYDHFRIHRRIPVTLSIKMDDGKVKHIVDKNIFGAVIERDNKYKLLNIFR